MSAILTSRDNKHGDTWQYKNKYGAVCIYIRTDMSCIICTVHMYKYKCGVSVSVQEERGLLFSYICIRKKVENQNLLTTARLAGKVRQKHSHLLLVCIYVHMHIHSTYLIWLFELGATPASFLFRNGVYYICRLFRG